MLTMTMGESSESASIDDYLGQFSVDVSGEDYQCDHERRQIFVFNFILTVFGFLSAAVLVTILLFKSNLRSSPYILLNMLILSFLIQLVISGIVYTEEAFDPCWRAGRVFCLVVKIVEPIFTYSVVVFLIAVAIQQCYRYSGRESNSPSPHNCLLVILLWFLVLVFSAPELIIAISEPSHPQRYSDDICYVGLPSLAAYYVITSKQFLLEYFLPLLAVYALIVVLVILRQRSRSFPAQNSINGPTLRRVSPKYFVLLVAITLTYTIGYFPRYVFMLANFIMRISPPEGKASDIWGHMKTIDTLFALIPPTFAPLFIILLSRSHLKAVMELLHYMKIRISGSEWRSDRIAGNTHEEETNDIVMNPL